LLLGITHSLGLLLNWCTLILRILWLLLLWHLILWLLLLRSHHTIWLLRWCHAIRLLWRCNTSIRLLRLLLLWREWLIVRLLCCLLNLLIHSSWRIKTQLRKFRLLVSLTGWRLLLRWLLVLLVLLLWLIKLLRRLLTIWLLRLLRLKLLWCHNLLLILWLLLLHLLRIIITHWLSHHLLLTHTRIYWLLLLWHHWSLLLLRCLLLRGIQWYTSYRWLTYINRWWITWIIKSKLLTITSRSVFLYQNVSIVSSRNTWCFSENTQIIPNNFNKFLTTAFHKPNFKSNITR